MNLRLILYIIIPIILALTINLITYITGTWRMRDNEPNKLLPPGFVVGTVWMILFGILGYVLYLLRGNAAGSMVTIIFLIYALAYNYLPVSLFNLWNLIALLLAFMIVITVLLTEPSTKFTKYVLLLSPLLAWTIYVNVIFSLKK